MPNPISNLGLIKNLQIGGLTITDFTGLKILAGYTSSNTRSALVDTSVAASSFTAYQVPVGKTFTAVAAILRSSSQGINKFAEFCYADTSLSLDSGGSPTNEMIFGGTSAGGLGGMAINTSALVVPSTQLTSFAGFSYVVPASKYPHIKIDSAAAIHFLIYGYEV